MRRSVSSSQGVKRAAGVLVRSPGNSRGGLREVLQNRHQIIRISSLPMGLGHIIQAGAPHLLWGDTGRTDATSAPSRMSCPNSEGDFALFLVLSSLRKKGTIMGPLMVSSHPISKLNFLFVVPYSLSCMSKKFVSILGANNFYIEKLCII